MQILLSRYFPFPPFWISLLTGLLFFNNILKYHILNDFNAGLLHVLICDDFYCTEVFDRNNNFKYIELFLKLGSDYRVVLEEFKIGDFKSFHEILKIFK